MLLRSWLERFGKKLVVGRGRRKPPLAVLERLENRSLMSVNPTAVTFTATEAATFSGTVATFTSNDALPQSAGNYFATIDWGSGATPGTVVADPGGGFDVIGTHEFTEAGTPDVKVTINDAADKSHKTVHSQANVFEQPLTLTARVIETTEGTAFSGLLGTFSDPGTSGDPDEYVAKINWGDGQTSFGTLSHTGGANFDLSGRHTYSDEGSYTATATVWESGSPATVVSAPISVTVDDGDNFAFTNMTIAPAEGRTFSGVVSVMLPVNDDAEPSDFTASINWGDGQTTAGVIRVTENGWWEISGSHTYGDEGWYKIRTTIGEDGANGASFTSKSVAIVSDSDVLAGTGLSLNATEGSAFSGAVATFLNTGYPGNPATDFTATIDWGDGTTGTGTVSGNAGNYTVAGSHTYQDEGFYTPVVTLNDNAPGTASATICSSMAVADADVLSGTGMSLTATEGSAFAGAVATFTNTGYPANPATDFAATIDWGDGTTDTGTVSGSAGNFIVTGSHTYQDEGSYSPIVTLSDLAKGSASATAASSMTVSDADALSGTGMSLTATEGSAFSGAVATFMNSGYAANPVSDFAATIDWGDGTTDAGTISGSAGNFTVTGSHTYQDEGNYTPLVTLNDLAAGSASATTASSMTVVDADALSGSGMSLAATEGIVFSGALATFTNTGYAGNPSSDFTATIDWGDGTTGAGTVSGGAGTFTVIGSHTYQDEGSYTPVVTLSDLAAGSTSATAASSMTVADADALSGTGMSLTATEGSSFSGAVATFSNTGYAGNPSTDFTAAIDWGDGTISAGTVSGGAGSFTVTGSHTYQDEGSYTPVVTLSDLAAGSASATASGTAVVAEGDAATLVSATITPTEGQLFSGVVGTFTDINLSQVSGDFTANIDWGDGTTTTGTVTGGSGNFTISGNHTYADEGTYTIAASFSDDAPSTLSATITSTATVSEADVLSGAGLTLVATEGSVFSGAVATFMNTGYAGNPSTDFAATIDWGDGTTGTGTISGGAGNFTVTGSHTYQDEGSYTPVVTLSDDDGNASGAASSSMTVADAESLSGTGSSLSATEGSAFSGTVATFTNTGYPGNPSADFAAMIDWGDGTTDTGTVSGGAGAFTVSGSHTYLDEGTYTPLVTLSDDDGNASATASSTMLVADADTLTPESVTTGAIRENEAVGGPAAVFYDAGYATNDPADFTGTFDWGDGTTYTTAAGNVSITSDGTGNFTLSVAAHTYADEGVYTVVASLADDAPGSATASQTGTLTISEADSLTPSATPATLTGTEGMSVAGSVATFTNTGYASNSAADFTATIDWGDGTTTAGTVSGGSGADLTVGGSHTYADDGSYTITTTIADDTPGTAVATTTATANIAEADLTLSPAATTLTFTEGTTFSGAVATISDPGSTDVAGNFTANIDWGDGTTTAGTIAGAVGAYTVVGSHAYADEGAYTIAVTAAELGAVPVATATTSLAASVAEGDFGTLTPTTITPAEGQAFSGAVASFTDPGNPLQVAGDFTATIDWGDGTTTAGTVTGSTGGPFTINGNHTYADEGTYTILASFSDDSPSTLTGIPITSSAAVSDSDVLTGASLTLSATEGTAFTGVVATFTNTGYTGNPATDFTATIDWGDGTTETGTVSASAGNFTVTGSHTYQDEGSYSPVVTLSDLVAGSATATAASSMTVADADALIGTGLTLAASEGSAFTGAVATYTNTGYTGNPATDFTATIDWGDGTTDTGTVSGSAGNFTVTGSHTYQDEGTYAPVVTLSDDDGNASAAASASMTVADADALSGSGTSVTATEGTTFSGAVATFASANTNSPATDISATIDWGDGATTAGTVSGSAGNFTVSGSHLFADEGSFTTSIEVNENAPGTQNATITGSAAVAEGDSLSVTASPVSATQGTPFSGQVATFTDATYANKPLADLAATIDWGDGTVSAGTIADAGGGTFTVSGTHTYQTSAASQVEVTVSDASPGTATASSKAVVSLASVTVLGSSPIVGSSAAVNGYEFTPLNNVTVATFTHTGSDPTSNFSVNINWGDGTTSTGTVALSSGVYTVTGSHSYTDEGTFAVNVSIDDVPDGVSATVNSSATLLEELLPGGVRGTADERFINEVYRDILGRPADSSALAFYDAQLATSLTRVTVASEIIAMADASELRDQLIQQAFQKLLHRSAEAGALTYFGQLLASGTTIAQIDAMIISSNEYFLVRGGGSVDGFANAVFEDLLGRPIDSTSKRDVELFMAGGGTRFQVADLVMHSTEYENIFIENSFTAYLHRPADSGSLSFFDAQFALGASQNAIVADILGSNEYFSLVSS